MRINTDHQRENSLIFYQILSTDSFSKCIKISLENLYVDIGAKRINETSLADISHTFVCSLGYQKKTINIYQNNYYCIGTFDLHVGQG